MSEPIRIVSEIGETELRFTRYEIPQVVAQRAANMVETLRQLHRDGKLRGCRIIVEAIVEE